MAQYVLRPATLQSGQVGGTYHIGIGDGTNSYGYVFQNTGPEGGFKEETNITDKEKLVQYSSPNLIDRDLVFFPRVTQGDFSGGALQIVFIEPNKFFDSDLEIRTPGYLTLRPAWKRVTLTSGLGSPNPQSVFWNGDVYTTFQGGSYFNSAGTGFSGAGFTARFLDTDGKSLIIGDGANNISFTYDNSSFSSITTTASAFVGMWVVQQGTNGRFVYVAREFVGSGATAIHTIYKFDENATLPTGPVQLPTGNNQFFVLDIVAYQNGIAILTRDSNSSNTDIWYHDGVSMTRILHIPQYNASGITVCLGDLYVTGQSAGKFEGPELIKISSGSAEIVARPASPLALLTSATIGAPTSSGQYVYFALANPQITNVTTTSYVGIYDVITGAYSHLGNLDTLDSPQVAQPRQLVTAGRSAVFPFVNAGTGYLQYQTNNSFLAAGNTYQASGTLVSSKFDFATPGIPKRFRRIEAVHAPLQAGESVTLTAFLDGDQLHVGQTPQTATITNSTVATTITQLTMGADTVGRQMYFTMKLAGNGTTTPDINRVSVEIGGTWTWNFDLDCTNQRRLLNQATIDPQGVNGKDLYYLLRNSYENGNLLTLFLAEGVSYTVTIESLKAHNPGYVDHQGSPVKADEEWLVSAVLKQVA